LNRALDFCNRAHDESLIQQFRRCNGLFPALTKSAAKHDSEFKAEWANTHKSSCGDFWTDVLSPLQIEFSKKRRRRDIFVASTFVLKELRQERHIQLMSLQTELKIFADEFYKDFAPTALVESIDTIVARQNDPKASAQNFELIRT
jgi:hypothetical protein